jgi:urease accessory protein UreF
MLSRTLNQTEAIPVLNGDLQPLLNQVGAQAGWTTLTSTAVSLRCPRVKSRSTLRQFLEQYLNRILLPVELRAIEQACHLANRGAVRELVALDRKLTLQPEMREFAVASQRVGRAHLKRLLPLRDLRVVKRYWQAVAEGQAHGWHTLVYGLVLSIYSIPHRQGLINYVHLTLRGFIQAAGNPLKLSAKDQQELLEELMAEVPPRLTGAS